MDLHCNAPKAVEPVPKQPVVVEMLPPPAPAKAKEPVPKQPVVVEKLPPPAPAKAEAPVLAGPPPKTNAKVSNSIFAVNAPPALPETMMCSLCGSMVEKSNLRVHSKKKQEYKCMQCHATMHKMYRAGTKVPDLAAEDVAEFWKAASVKSEKELGPLVESFSIKKVETETEGWSTMSPFKPLSSWEKDGWNVQDIESKSKPHNKRWHDVAGWTYRVEIIQSGKAANSSTEKSEVHDTAAPLRKAAVMQMQSPPPAEMSMAELKAKLAEEQKKAKQVALAAKANAKAITGVCKDLADFENLVQKHESFTPAGFKEGV